MITERPQVVICLSSGMKLSLRYRLAVMTLTIVGLAAIIVGAATVAWRQVSALRRHFSSVQIESFHIAEHLQAAVLTLNATLLRFVLRRERGDWESFTRDSEQLEVWLRLSTPARPAKPQREAASAVVLLREIRDLMRSQLEKSGIELTVEDSTEITIHGDQNQLKQVLLNLIRNGAASVSAAKSCSEQVRSGSVLAAALFLRLK